MKRIRQISLAILILIGAAFLMAGSGNSADAPRGFTVVEYWEKWSGREAQQMQQIVDEFNSSIGQRDKIFVRFMSMTDVDQKMLVATAAGVPPDIAGLWDQQVSEFAALDAVEPLDDLARQFGISSDTYLPVFWNGCHYNGHLYGLVSTAGTVALIYNKQMFRAAGLDPDRPPQTLDELDRDAAAIDTVDSSGQIDRAGYVPLAGWYLPLLSYWFGGGIFDAQSGRFTIDSPQTLRAYEWIQSYSRRLGRRALMDFQNSLGAFDSPRNPILAGKLAMQQQGPWMADYIAHLAPAMSQVLVPTSDESKLARRADNYAWGVAAFPSAVAGLKDVSYCSFDVMMIPRGARHPREAFEFMAYVNRQDVAEKLAKMQSKNTQLRKVSREFLANHPNPYIGVYEALAASPNAHGVPPTPIWPEVFKELNDDGQAVALDGADPATVLAASQRRLQAEYDHFMSLQNRRKQLGID